MVISFNGKFNHLHKINYVLRLGLVAVISGC